MGDPDDRVRMHALSALKQIEPKTGQAKVQHYLLTANLSAAQKEENYRQFNGLVAQL